MSRRPNPAADRAEQNRQTLKSLVKLEANKSCSDCKRNKHPRWASWNIGVFVCIRCSGIHRGMGTHISRVKSVDLDSWTDEQLQSMLKWGNARANKYWEAKLAPGHVPSEAKIENFIRTKYESKRWVMDGAMPDPSTLDVSDDDMPLKKVQEKVQIERSASQRLRSTPNQLAQPLPRTQPTIDLFADETPVPQSVSASPSTARIESSKVEPAPPKPTKAGDSLLGLDFLGSAPTQPARPSSTGPAATATSRPDLKQSILSLYASKPATSSQRQQHAPQQAGYGELNDAFGGLSFGAPIQTQPKPSPFTGLDSFSSLKSTSSTSADIFGGGGNFFDSTPKAPLAVPTQRGNSDSNDFGDFSAFNSAPTKLAASSSGMGNLLDLSMPSAAAPVSNQTPLVTSSSMNSAFNLSNPAAPAPLKPSPASSVVPSNSGFSNMDAWGSTDAWASSGPSQSTHSITTTTESHTQAQDSGWGSPAVTQDDDFGGWRSAAPTTTAKTQTMHQTTAPSKPSGGLGGGDDLFSNVWE